MATPLDRFKEAQKDRSSLYSRMDEDATALQDPSYTLTDKDGKTLRNAISMCTNELQLFAAYVEASLDRAKESLVIESNDKSVDTGKLEEVGAAIWSQIAQKRRQQGKYPANAVLDQFNCRRGSSAASVAINVVTDETGNEKLDIEFVPWDPRYSNRIMGENDPLQAGREIGMKKDEIDSQPLAVKSGYTCPSPKAKQVEIWTPEDHLFYIDEKEAFSEPNPYGFVPVAFQEVPVGTMLQDNDVGQYTGESILYMVRDLVKERNRILSIINTKSSQSIKPPMQIKTGGAVENDDYENVTGMGRLTKVDDMNAIHPVMTPDLKESAIVLLNEIKEMLHSSTLKRIAITDIPSGGVSTATLLTIVQNQDALYNSRLYTRGLIKQTILEYIFRMIKALNLSSFNIGSSGGVKTYPLKILEGQYNISYIYANSTAESDSAQLALAQTYKNLQLLPDKILLKDILKRDDWEGDYNEMQRQKLRQYVPVLGIYDALMATSFIYKERGDDSILAELRIAEQYLGITAEQMKRGQLPQLQQEQPINVSGETSLGSSQRQAYDVKNAIATEEINAG
jgi:hypothetical protein